MGTPTPRREGCATDSRRRALASDVTLRLCATLSSSRISFDPHGLVGERRTPSDTWDRDWDRLLSRISEAGLVGPVLIDCTAAEEVALVYPRALRSGISIVSANKIAWSGSTTFYDEVRDARIAGGSKLAYGTTVGAAIPMIQLVRSAAIAGDEVLGLEGVLSGTLSFVLSRVNDGAPFSSAVREARDLGLTEPNPREDLRGTDVARKLLILLRESGRDVDPQDVRVESLVPEHLTDETDPDRFIHGLKSVDAQWARRADAAARSGKKLVYVAGTVPDAHAAVCEVPVEERLARLERQDGALEVRTRAYHDTPLFISGPGAGPGVTAMGVFTDLMEISATPPLRVSST